jgi:ketosteroid isomerase-like protein
MRLLLASAILLAGCAPKAEGPEQAQARIDLESSAARKAIDSLNTDFNGHFNAGHGDLVAAQYAEDGELQVVGGPLLKGRAAIAASVNELAKVKATITTTATSVSANGPLAIERGEYTLSISPGTPAPLTETGVYLIHWHRVNGTWLRVSDVASTAAPIPMGPAPTK